MQVSVTVNGKLHSADVEPRLLLVDFLRDVLGLTGTKSGCDTAQCGACTVLLDGISVKSCSVLAVQADGSQVTTIEGLAKNGRLDPLQEAFQEHHAVQDGFATPGEIMSLTDLLRRNSAPDEAEIRAWLNGNLDRSTGYQNVVRAAQSAARKLQGGRPEAPEAKPEKVLGASIKPREAPPLLMGEGQFVADIALPHMLHAAVLHSPHGHAIIKRIDTAAAEAMPGVVRVFTGADVRHLAPLPVVWSFPGVESHFPPHPSGMLPGAQQLLASERVRFVGEYVAAVVAETRQQAYDAVDAIEVEYEPLPVVLDAEEALKEGAPQIHDAVPGNLNAHATHGDREATEKAIAGAEVVVRQRFRNQRMINNAIETRGSVGLYDEATGDYTLWTNTQIPHANRFLISQYVLGIPYNKLRVIVPNIGGSNGSKGYLYQDAPLVLFLSKETGRPVKWVDTRWGLPRTTVNTRGQIQDVVLAGTKDGRITALHCTAHHNMGAYSMINGQGVPIVLVGRSITGAYAIPHPCYSVYTVFTNTVPLGPMRGAGRADAIFLIERMVDLFAREIGMDPVEVRRKNLVRPDQFPYANGLGWTYDSGHYEAALDKALAKIDYGAIPARKKEARQRGKRLGLGVASYVAIGGVGPSPHMGLVEGLIGSTWASTHLNAHPDGEVEVTVGAQPHGQSQETTLAQIVAQELGIDMDRVRIRHSDTKGAPYGQGSYGSRTFSVEGTAVYAACQKVKDKARKVGAYLLKASEDEAARSMRREHRRRPRHSRRSSWRYGSPGTCRRASSRGWRSSRTSIHRISTSPPAPTLPWSR
jgi:carbon-monoxide dehydrogenase large subunit